MARTTGEMVSGRLCPGSGQLGRSIGRCLTCRVCGSGWVSTEQTAPVVPSHPDYRNRRREGAACP